MRRGIAVLALASVLLAGCGGAAAPAAPSSGAATAAPKAGKLTPITVQLPWLWAGYDAFLVAAQKLGYFKAAGLDAKIIPSTASNVTAEAVAGGHANFGFADAASVADLISKGAPLKTVAGIVQTTPYGLVYNPAAAIKSPAQLKGKTVIVNASGGPVVQLLTAVLARYHLTPADVHENVVAASAEAALFEQHPDYYLSTLVNSNYPAITLVDPKAQFTSYSHWGINLLSLSLIASDSTIKQHPAEVRAFVAAALRGWNYAAQHPQQAENMLHAYAPQTKMPILLKSLQVTLPLVHTPATQGKPLGWMAAADWQGTLSLLHQYGGMPAGKPLPTYYTNAFLPKG